MAKLNNTHRPAFHTMATNAKAAAVTMNAHPAKHRFMRALLEHKAMFLANIGMAISGLVLSLTVLVTGPANAADSGLQYVNRTTTNGLGSNSVRAVYVVGSNVYAATDAGLSISTDGGATFTNKTTANTANGLGSNDVRGVFVVGSTIYAATKDTTYGYGSPTKGGLSISTNGGTTFTNKTIADGLGSNNVNTVFVDGSTIYVGTSVTSEVITTAPITAANITSNIATLTTSTPHGLVVGSIVQVSGVVFTLDGTYSVTAVPSTTQFSFAKTAADYTLPAPAGTAKLMVAGGLSISTNGGVTFTHFNSTALCGSVSCNHVRAIYASGSNIYLATDNRLVYSNDGGTTFTHAPNGELSTRGVFKDGTKVFLGSNFGLQVSTDNFATAPALRNSLDGLGDGAANVETIAMDSGKLYVGTWGGLSISSNGGTSFTNDTPENCLGGYFVSGVFVSGGTIYAATDGGLSISTGPGVGCRTAAAAPAAIPTLSEWAMILMASFMGLFAFVRLRKVTLG